MRILFGLVFASIVLADGNAAGARIAGDPPSNREWFSNSGKGDFVFDAWEGSALKVWHFLPEAFKADSTIVIVMHGNSRDGDRDQSRCSWATPGHRHGRRQPATNSGGDGAGATQVLERAILFRAGR
jgi:hypothetical protein